MKKIVLIIFLAILFSCHNKKEHYKPEVTGQVTRYEESKGRKITAMDFSGYKRKERDTTKGVYVYVKGIVDSSKQPFSDTLVFLTNPDRIVKP
ncbi:hypothetical protein FRZ67_05635 [Panacibacter ginsenosidivorans]|uniref:Uncharacterized protein n=1 Tax=Panacibacter ginsenosidivorans TaxID=1813871 RepID=A0A5B8V8Y4_9BACT|nr:hypothetical protein [Panacibacter ginsenosidivorans]QEC66808.1 hypothetical protein FRZ67_05635 [Panacibacter ginsenosidivorans]